MPDVHSPELLNVPHRPEKSPPRSAAFGTRVEYGCDACEANRSYATMKNVLSRPSYAFGRNTGPSSTNPVWLSWSLPRESLFSDRSAVFAFRYVFWKT